MKYDGHTHTEYCPHGTVEDTELLIQRAIQLGFTKYSITEHAPLPPAINKIAGGDSEMWTTASMALNDVDNYFKRMENLRKKYASEIVIHIGFELDYFPEFEDWTTDFLNEYGPLTDDGVLSVHFLPGQNGLRGIDYTFEEYRDGITIPSGSFKNAQTLYYERVLQSLQADLGKWKPTRLGHISLCQKFERFFEESTDYSPNTVALIDELLQQVKERNYRLDLNTAGFRKKGYTQSYPQPWILEKSHALGIPLIYGSDSHSIEDIGSDYGKVEHWLNK
ncbi:histidinol-phosphatase HisJ [Enterococcus sp. BWR-S5]|uniref:histidinol-phosphatase HisJ n=1 Tax=Enterococcus sp. BWR-S5 TaxID=2787714 RepID=UPI0019206E58|nr:histidinol-phosphatase HisJ [Enterococcus sp. BWR-S5]MBL1226865.1 histidinol-phosphatase HisJ [Enterococcus sp. BWR-S5]